MLYPVVSYTCLASGLIMMSTSAFVIYKVYKGSKSRFAYTFMAFSFLDGAQNFAFFFIYVFRHPVSVNNKTLHAENFYAYQTVSYFYYSVSLQSWIFGMKYLKSAMFCSLTPPCVPS